MVFSSSFAFTIPSNEFIVIQRIVIAFLNNEQDKPYHYNNNKNTNNNDVKILLYAKSHFHKTFLGIFGIGILTIQLPFHEQFQKF